jgi:D-amino-acid dehydrogenase
MQEIGCFMLYKNTSTEKHEIELAQEAAHLNIDTKILSAQEVQAMEPDVEVNVRGGILYPIDCHLHPGDFMQTMRDHLKKTGVRFQLNSRVMGFERRNGYVNSVITDKGYFACKEVVLANGSWLPLTSKILGIDILMQAGKGYSMTYEKVGRNLRYPAILVDNRVAMTPMGADLRMGGTMEISGLHSPLLIKRAQAIFKAAKSYYPDLPVQFMARDKIWSGFRPLTPDGLPYIGRHKNYHNLVIAGGHAMLGLSLAAGTGKLVEELVTRKPTSIAIDAFNVQRFH